MGLRCARRDKIPSVQPLRCQKKLIVGAGSVKHSFLLESTSKVKETTQHLFSLFLGRIVAGP